MRRRSQKSGVKPLFSKKVIWVIFTTMVISLIAIPNLKPKANDANVIKVLEIEPGNKFRLNSAQASGANPAVQVTHMDMPTFISSIEEVKGNYDVVYIGRYNQGLSSNWNTDYVYRDYSAPFSQDRTALAGSYGGKDTQYRKATTAIWYATQGKFSDNGDFWSKYYLQAQSGNGNVYTKIDSSSDYKKVLEYMPENDITDKRAKEIKKMIESNQLVYIDSSVFQIAVSKDSPKPKLLSNFSDYTNSKYSNYHRVENNNLTIQNIIDAYKGLSSNLKRPNIDNVVGPSGDVYTDSNNQQVIVTDLKKRAENRNLSFSFNLKDTVPNMQYEAILYLDIKGDGIYQDEDKVGTYFLGTDSGNKNLTYELLPKFIGYLDWKIEVYSEPIGTATGTIDVKTANNIKTNLSGHAIFKNVSNTKVPLHVLQLTSNDGNLLDLRENKEFCEVLKKADDYDVTIDSQPCTWLNDKTLADIQGYNMIIMGFADSYGNKITDNTFSNDLNANAVSIIKNFLSDKNKSIMLTHDTIGLSILGDTKIGGNQLPSIKGGNLFTRTFRDIAGQSRYDDPFNKNTDIKHDSTEPSGNNITLGASAYSSVKLYDSDYGMTTTVKKVNTAQITSYPYNLDSLDENNHTIRVSNTHPQWYQLNLEADDLVPWYNLSRDDKYNSGDSRNFYYTYSIGNITYSGTGHSGDYPTDELQLFVNTIVKAARAVNTPPEITNRQSDNKTVINNEDTVKINGLSDFSFYANLYDLDGQNGKEMGFKVYIGDNEKLSVDKIILYDRKGSEYGGIDQKITIPSSYLSQKVGSGFKVTVYAEDADNGTCEREFYVQVASDKVVINHGVDLTDTNKDEQMNWNQENVDRYISPNNTIVSEKYYTVVPFAARINMSNTDSTISLTLDSKFSPNYSADNTTAAINTAYEDKVNGYLLPKVYVVKSDGTLAELKDGEMKTINQGITYFCNITKDNVINSGASIVDGRCNIVVKYYGKTYYEDTSDKKTTQYKNTIEVNRNDKNLNSQDAIIEIGFNKVSGILY